MAESTLIAPVTVRQAAALIGVSPRRIQAHIRDGRLPAERVGPAYRVSAIGLANIVRQPCRSTPRQRQRLGEQA